MTSRKRTRLGGPIRAGPEIFPAAFVQSPNAPASRRMGQGLLKTLSQHMSEASLRQRAMQWTPQPSDGTRGDRYLRWT